MLLECAYKTSSFTDDTDWQALLSACLAVPLSEMHRCHRDREGQLSPVYKRHGCGGCTYSNISSAGVEHTLSLLPLPPNQCYRLKITFIKQSNEQLCNTELEETIGILPKENDSQSSLRTRYQH